MVELKRLVSIVSNLSPIENRSIQRSLKLNGSDDQHLNSTLKLFEYVKSNKAVNIEAISKEIYGQINYSALRKLCQRLIDRILVLLINVNLLSDPEIYSDRSIKAFNIRVKLLFYDVLNIHKVQDYAKVLLNNIITLSKQMEYYDYLIMGLDKKLIKASLGSGRVIYEKLYEEIKFFQDCNIALRESSYLIRLYSSNYRYNNREFTNDKLKVHIDKINKDFERTRSKRIKFNLFLLKGIFFDNVGDYKSSRDNFIQQWELLRSNKVIFSDDTIHGSLLNIAYSELKLGNIEEAKLYVKKMLLKRIENSYNLKLIKEFIFIVHFYSADYTQMSNSIKDLLSSIEFSNQISFMEGRHLFYYAVLLTIEGRYIDSNKILIKCKILDKDKDGWNIGYRVLSIINNIELEKFVYVEAQIENLRKHISRMDSHSKNYSRDKVISKILNGLVKYSFDFKKTNQLLVEHISNLSSLQIEYKWKYKSPELIPFHEWFQSKVKGVSYDHVEAMKRLRKMNKRG